MNTLYLREPLPKYWHQDWSHTGFNRKIILSAQSLGCFGDSEHALCRFRGVVIDRSARNPSVRTYFRWRQSAVYFPKDLITYYMRLRANRTARRTKCD